VTIVRRGGKYCLISKKTGRNLGCYRTRAGAERRERQVQYFKHNRRRPEQRQYAVDVDGVLAEMVEAALARLNREWGTHYTKYDLTDWDFWHLLPELSALPEPKQKDKLFRTMEAAWEAGEVRPTPGAAAFMRRLRAHGRVTIVTKTLARDELLREWLRDNDIVYDELIHIPKGSKLSKATFQQFDVFVDDSPKLAEEVPTGKTLLLVDQPWNQNVDMRSHVRRIYSLHEAIPSEP